MRTFLPKCFGGSRKSHTFASAFENERDLKQIEISSEIEANKERVLWKDLHKTEVVQEARMMKHSFLGRRKNEPSSLFDFKPLFGSSFWNRYKQMPISDKA